MADSRKNDECRDLREEKKACLDEWCARLVLSWENGLTEHGFSANERKTGDSPFVKAIRLERKNSGIPTANVIGGRACTADVTNRTVIANP